MQEGLFSCAEYRFEEAGLLYSTSNFYKKYVTFYEFPAEINAVENSGYNKLFQEDIDT